MLEMEQLQRIIEGALFAAGQPLSVDRIAQLFEEEESRPDNKVIREVLDAIKESYQQRTVQLVEIASGFQFQVTAEVSPWIRRLWEEKPTRYSRALYETLVLIAYRQPITRAEIEEVRGVSVNTNTIKTLYEREWIRVVGHRDVPGRPALYATSKQFLDYFNLKNLDELPSLMELQDLDAVALQEESVPEQISLPVETPQEEVVESEQPQIEESVMDIFVDVPENAEVHVIDNPIESTDEQAKQQNG